MHRKKSLRIFARLYPKLKKLVQVQARHRSPSQTMAGFTYLVKH